MSPYLSDLIERLADRTQVSSSAESISWAAHREAESLTDVGMVDELVQAVKTLSREKRAACYFIIGKIGLNGRDERCAAALLDSVSFETDKHNLEAILLAIGKIPKGPHFDLSLVYPLLEDKRSLVRHAAIHALDNSANPDSELRVIGHLAGTIDEYDQAYCHQVLGNIGTPRALPAIEANLKSRKRDVKGTAKWASEAIRERYS